MSGLRVGLRGIVPLCSFLGYGASCRSIQLKMSTSMRNNLGNTCRSFSNCTMPWRPSSLRRCPTGSPTSGCSQVKTGYKDTQCVQTRVFRTSPRNEIPPLVFLLIRPLGKLVSIIGGRTFRKWWKRLTPEMKEHYKNRFLKRKSTIALAVGFLTVASGIHYYTHLQTTPVTHRERYVSLSPHQLLKISHFEYEVTYELVKDKIIPESSPIYKRINNIVQRIIKGNQDLEYMRNQKFIITVVNDDEPNASVFPTGHIFVNTGLLKVIGNDDQLAVVLGHEIAHALLGHAAEHVSFATALDVIVIIALAAIWAFMPTDGIAIITEWFYHKVMKLMLNLPYSRKLELEADEVGLHLIAKACYDVRESTVFWSLMAARFETDDETEMSRWSSTHPASTFRAQKLDQLIPKALHQRETCSCPSLSKKDPRAQLVLLKQLIDKGG